MREGGSDPPNLHLPAILKTPERIQLDGTATAKWLHVIRSSRRFLKLTWQRSADSRPPSDWAVWAERRIKDSDVG